MTGFATSVRESQLRDRTLGPLTKKSKPSCRNYSLFYSQEGGTPADYRYPKLRQAEGADNQDRRKHA